MALVGLNNLCSPAQFYLVISMITIFVIALQNYNNVDVYCLGNYSCNVNTVFIFIIKIIYVLFWTWVLNIICSAGGKNVAWFLVLFPYIILFILLTMLMV